MESVMMRETTVGGVLREAAGSPGQRLPEVGPDDDAQIQYTSGTTGFPQGWVNPMPLFHTAGCVLLTLGPVQHLCAQVLAQLGHPSLANTDTSAIRVAFSGGATVPPALVR
ncbi:MAG TPA: hypothetical protein VHU92_30570 [Streptosporangiaceae bacterium]|nr:hypothetical protein [Streptosporangiaceae bacterium]